VKRPLRILHGTYEIAGQGMVLAQGLNAAGADAKSLAYRVDWDGRRPQLIVELDPLPLPARALAMATTFARYAPAFDVFHFHFGTSFVPKYRWDVPLLKALGKVVVFHFHGCEVRNRSLMLERHALAACTECRPFCVPEEQRRLLAQAARDADLVFYSTKDLAESVPGGMELPLAIDVERWESAGRAFPLVDPARRDGVRGPVVIAHAPTNRWIKGTHHIEAAVEALKPEFPLLELRLIEGRPWSEMPRVLAECDLLVDQLFMGWYGLLAIEGMSEGKAVVCYLRPEFAAADPGCPVVSATPETLAEALRALIQDPARREALGDSGRAWARARHDAPVVGRALLAQYEAILSRRAAR
jgi:glycosyltransferase involved in cell wall biosynthesis